MNETSEKNLIIKEANILSLAFETIKPICDEAMQYVVSLGETCHSSFALKTQGLKKYSCPCATLNLEKEAEM